MVALSFFITQNHVRMTTERKIFTVTDLGGGDGGKGSVVHKICVEKNAHHVLKVGGAQGSHGVRTSNGQKFNFSQFGCGTLEGVRTHITDRMIIEPLGLMREAEMLKYELGINTIYDYLTIDENALCITPYHANASQLRELARKDKPKGTVAIGGGEAMRDACVHPELAIYARDLASPKLIEKLEAIRVQKIKDLAHIMDSLDHFWKEDWLEVRKQKDFLECPATVEVIAAKYKQLSMLANIVGLEYLKDSILKRDGVIVVESSHGILTDRFYGFHPHTTQLRTLPQGTLDLLGSVDYDGDIVKLGITRAYQIRHGAGPMVTESDDLNGILLPNSYKTENRWQGKVRTGALDLVALRYAIEVCGGPQFFDGLCITWMDQIQGAGNWQVCDRYSGIDAEFFTSPNTIKVRRGEDDAQLAYQERLGKVLMQCSPIVTSQVIPEYHDREGLTDLCAQTLYEKLGVPVRMISYGATELDKVLM